jgi:hypothetical protein
MVKLEEEDISLMEEQSVSDLEDTHNDEYATSQVKIIVISPSDV